MNTLSGRALIIGAGKGLSAAVARRLAADGWQVDLSARDADKLTGLCAETGATAHTCDATDPDQVASLFANLDRKGGAPTFVLYNPSYRARGPITDLDPGEVRKAIEVSAFGGFLVAQQAAKRMLDAGSGAIFFTGASASVKGYANSSSFAMGKFALRGLAQSLARELHPQGIHVAHFVIDGGIAADHREGRQNTDTAPDRWLEPDAIAETYMAILGQHRSAWTWEVEIRPWGETF
ncbi:MAG: SDR family NAD(P)-dependent oxidoreductase [Rhodospirillales bacterium]